MLKTIVAKLLSRAGYGVYSIRGEKARSERKWSWLKLAGIGTVLDIGASTGQFASKIHRILPDALLYSFEPLAECYAELVENSHSFPGFRAFNLGLSDTEGTVEFYKNQNHPSSSLLPLSSLHRELYPFAANTTKETIEVVRLDELAKEINIRGNLLIKMDVQGGEDKVVRGGIGFFKKALVVITEVSFFELYQGQPLFHQIFELLDSLGFAYIGSIVQFNSPVEELPAIPAYRPAT